MFYNQTGIGANDQPENAGFVRVAYLVDHREVLGILDPVRFPNAFPGKTVPKAGITAVNGVTLTKLERLPLLGVFSEPRVESAQGYTYQPVFNFDFPKNSPELLAWLMTTEGRRYVMLWEDRNGFAHITGNEDNALRLTYTRSVNDANALLLQLQASMPIPTWGLESIVPEELFPEADFSFDFSLYFNS